MIRIFKNGGHGCVVIQHVASTKSPNWVSGVGNIIYEETDSVG